MKLSLALAGQLISSYGPSDAVINKRIKPGAVRIPYGSGCKEGGKSCFECKLPDCVWMCWRDNLRSVERSIAHSVRAPRAIRQE